MKLLISILSLMIVILLVNPVKAATPITQDVFLSGNYNLAFNKNNGTIQSVNLTVKIENATFINTGLNADSAQSFGTSKTITLSAAIDTETLTALLIGNYGNQTQSILQRIETSRTDLQAHLQETWFVRFDEKLDTKINECDNKLQACLTNLNIEKGNATNAIIRSEASVQEANRYKEQNTQYLFILGIFFITLILAGLLIMGLRGGLRRNNPLTR